jgi:hypothetical protein
VIHPKESTSLSGFGLREFAQVISQLIALAAKDCHSFFVGAPLNAAVDRFEW